MKKNKLTFAVLLFLGAPAWAALTPTQRIAAAEKNTEGRTFSATSTMIVHKEGDTREMTMKTWLKDRQLAMVKLLAPAKDRDTGNLRIGTDLWQYLPKVNRIIRVPSSAMLQSWMGSDFSNDDLVRGGSFASDYTHKLLAHEKLDGVDAEKIECLPKPGAPIVWGKVIFWVRSKDNAPMRQEFFSEHGELVKTLVGEKIQNFSGHVIPTVLTMTSVKKTGSKTEIQYDAKTIQFDKEIGDDFFTQESLRKGMN